MAATVLSEPRALKPFALTRGDGSAFTESSLAGQWSLVFFGFTHCPDVCPSALIMLDKVKETLGDIEIVFISVDSRRDTPEIVQQYVEYFDPEFIGVTGDEQGVKDATSALSVAYEFIPSDDGSEEYTVVHSSTVILVDPAGRMHAIFTPPLHADAIAHDVQLLQQGY